MTKKSPSVRPAGHPQLCRKSRFVHTSTKSKGSIKSTVLRKAVKMLQILLDEMPDITDKAMNESEERYRSVVEHIQEVIFHVDTKGHWTFLNSAWSQITGYTVEESLGRSFSDFILPEHVPDAFEYLHQVMAGDSTNLPREVKVRTKSGECKWLELRANLHRNAANDILGLHGSLCDITDQKQHQDALLLGVSLLTSTIESTADGILAVDLAGAVVSYNQRFAQMLMTKDEGWMHQRHGSVIQQISGLLRHPEAFITLARHIEQYPEWTGSDRMELLDGSIFEIFSKPQWLEREIVGRVWSFRDVTEREKAVEDLCLQRQYLRSIIDTDPNLIFIKDERGILQLVNQAYADAYGSTIDEMIGKSMVEINSHPDEVDMFNRTDLEVLTSLQDRFLPEVKFTNAKGEVRWLQASKRPIYSPDKRAFHVLGIATDITDRRNFEEELSHQALHDRLTGLPNRALFMDRLQRSLARIQRTGVAISVLTLDLDNFQVVNDSLGHHLGDLLLVEIATRLQNCVYPGDTVARLGGDEFAVILEQIPDASNAAAFAERISNTLHQLVNLSGHEIMPTVSTGITICRGNSIDPGKVVRDADTAMYQAKTTGRAGYAVYQPQMKRTTIKRLEMQADLHRAICRNELKLHYQPVVDLLSGQIIGTEALLRWEHPKMGIISPTQFIPVAEETGLIISIGEWVLREACDQTQEWQAKYPDYSELSVGVNVSLCQLKHNEFMERTCRIVDATGLDPADVKLEITESVMMQDVEMMIARLAALKSHGIRLAIDDFGTGYSCMAYLIRLPIDIIKIDRIFVSRLGEDTHDDAVLQSIVNLANALELEIISEGIESIQQLRLLQGMGSHYGQGYYFSRPLQTEAMEILLASSSRHRFPLQ